MDATQKGYTDRPSTNRLLVVFPVRRWWIDFQSQPMDQAFRQDNTGEMMQLSACIRRFQSRLDSTSLVGKADDDGGYEG